jgi:ankyrin repeat protein
VDGIPPPLHDCIYHDKPEMLEWLLDHGADIERREQDYGSTPLNCAVVMRHKRIIRTLVERGADATHAMDRAQRGLAGDFEDDPRLDREGYREIVELLRELDIGSRQ